MLCSVFVRVLYVVLGLLARLPSGLALPLTVPRSSRVVGSPDGGCCVQICGCQGHEPIRRNAPAAALEPSAGLILLRKVSSVTSSV